MSSRQILANRANAKASTGPKTVQGKARVAQNARRHGLSLSVMADAAYGAAVETLAHEIAGADSRPDILHLARRVAEAQIDLSRIRQARANLLAHRIQELNAVPSRASIGTGATHTATGASHTSTDMPTIVETCPLTERALAPALSAELLASLLAIDRYERRALSRRKFAIRELDAALHNN